MGVTIYELLAGKRPWEIFERSKMITATYTFPDYFDKPTREFISGCLTIDPNDRIGWNSGEDFEKEMFELDFFKDKINTDKIHEQTPPIDKEVVKRINDRINEESDNQDSKNDDNTKFHDKLVLLHDGYAYQGQWYNYKRHGEGTLYKRSDDGNLEKVYQGNWYNDKPSDRHGTYYDGLDSVKVEITLHYYINRILWYTRSPTAIQDTWTIKAAFRQKLYLNNRFVTWGEYNKRWKELDNFKYRSECNGEEVVEHIRNMVSRLCNLVYFGNGDIYIGQFDTKHLRHGQGLNFNADGTVYSGTWQNNIKHGPAVLYSDYNICHNDKNYIIEMIKQLIISCKREYEYSNEYLVPISENYYRYKPFKEVLEAQEKRVSETGLDLQASYIEKQQWKHGKLKKKKKVKLPSKGESD